MEVRIENWELIFVPEDRNPYMAPELWPSRLGGEVYGHPDFEDGEWITSSIIVDTNGYRVKTKSRVYCLGNVHEKYAAWCRKQHPKVDLSSPFPKKTVDW